MLAVGIDWQKFIKQFEKKEYFTYEDNGVLGLYVAIGISSCKPDQYLKEIFDMDYYQIKQAIAASQLCIMQQSISLIFELCKDSFFVSKMNDRGYVELVPQDIDIEKVLVREEKELYQENYDAYKKMKKSLETQLKMKLTDGQLFKILRDAFAHNNMANDEAFNFRTYGGENIQLKLKINKTKRDVNVNIKDIYSSVILFSYLCSNLLDKSMYVWKGNTFGYIYDDGSVESMDIHQKSYINKLKKECLKQYGGIPEKILNEYFPCKDNAIRNLTQLLQLNSELSYWFNNYEKPLIAGALSTKSSSERSAILLIAILANILANEETEQIHDKLSKKLKIKNDKKIFQFVDKVRNSLIHGRYYVNWNMHHQDYGTIYLYDGKTNMYQDYRDLNVELQSLYKPYIESGKAENKIKNLKFYAKCNLETLTELTIALLPVDLCGKSTFKRKQSLQKIADMIR